jgi:hypothetical protein
MKIKFIFMLITIISLFSCDLFVKKNPQDLIYEENKNDRVVFLNSITVTGSPLISYIKITNDNKTLLYVDGVNNLYSLNINNDGTLGPENNTGINTSFYNINADGNIYSYNDQLRVYDKYYNEKYSYASNLFTNIIISPDSRFLYGINPATANYYCYEINNDGSLTFKNTYVFITLAPTIYELAQSADGCYIYYYESASPNYHIYKRDPQTGKLSLLEESYTFTYHLVCPVISNDQNYIYGYNASTTDIIRLSRDTGSGKISSKYDAFTVLPSGGNFNNGLKISNDDKRLYFLYTLVAGPVYFGSYNLERNYMDFSFQINGTIQSIAVSKNDKYIYVGTDNIIYIFKRITE